MNMQVKDLIGEEGDNMEEYSFGDVWRKFKDKKWKLRRNIIYSQDWFIRLGNLEFKGVMLSKVQGYVYFNLKGLEDCLQYIKPLTFTVERTKEKKYSLKLEVPYEDSEYWENLKFTLKDKPELFKKIEDYWNKNKDISDLKGFLIYITLIIQLLTLLKEKKKFYLEEEPLEWLEEEEEDIELFEEEEIGLKAIEEDFIYLVAPEDGLPDVLASEDDTIDFQEL